MSARLGAGAGSPSQPAGPVRRVLLSELVHFSPKQLAFLEAVRRFCYVLYGGAAGGGKSYILRWWLIIFLLEAYAKYGIRGCRVGLFCEDYNSLRDRQISKLKHEVPAWLGEVKNTKDEGLVFMLPTHLGEGFISLRNLDDPSKYLSVEFAAIGVEELTRNKQAVFEDLRQRLRWPGFPVGFKFPFGAATNPGGIGHGWVKGYWIDRDIPGVLDPREFVYIPALASDNPYLPADYEEKQLGSIVDPQVRKAYKDGDWDVFRGQFFSEWRNGLHIRPAFAIPGWWRRWRSSDWGYAVPWATLWFAMDPEGTVYVYREMYETNLGVPAYCEVVKQLSQGETYDFSVLDPACWNAGHDGAGVRQKSIAQQCADEGVQFERAANDRVAGWTQTRSYLAWKQDEAGRITQQPKLVIFDNCKNLIRTLPTLPYAEKREDDADTKAEDHAPDALRYGLMALPPLTKQPIETMAQEDAEALIRLRAGLDGMQRRGASWPGAY